MSNLSVWPHFIEFQWCLSLDKIISIFSPVSSITRNIPKYKGSCQIIILHDSYSVPGLPHLNGKFAIKYAYQTKSKLDREMSDKSWFFSLSVRSWGMGICSLQKEICAFIESVSIMDVLVTYHISDANIRWAHYLLLGILIFLFYHESGND